MNEVEIADPEENITQIDEETPEGPYDIELTTDRSENQTEAAAP